jgi:hypothetical protein
MKRSGGKRHAAFAADLVRTCDFAWSIGLKAGIGLMPFGVIPAKERVRKSASPHLSWPGLTRFSSAGSPSSPAGRINHARLAGVAFETAH